jgi:hypothetical protein
LFSLSERLHDKRPSVSPAIGDFHEGCPADDDVLVG